MSDVLDLVAEQEARAMARFESSRLRNQVAHNAVPDFGGACVDCGNAIGTARLAVLPSARRCIGCAQRLERGA